MKWSIFHVVVMRFGIGIFDPVWLTHRIGLLSAIAAPSLKAQDWCADTVLLVQVDERLDEFWLERLRKVLTPLPVEIQKLELHGDRSRALTEYCVKRANENEYSHVLTTRMDDDDGLGRGTLEALRRGALKVLATGAETGLIVVENTIRYLADRNLGLRIGLTVPETAGLSVLTNRKVEWTAYRWSHKRAVEEVKKIGGKVVWLNEKEANGIYTIHRMSDSDYERRVVHMIKIGGMFELADGELERFGLGCERLMDWQAMDRYAPTLGAETTTGAIGAIEKLIAAERKGLGARKEKGSVRLRALLADRERLGEWVTQELAPQKGVAMGNIDGSGKRGIWEAKNEMWEDRLDAQRRFWESALTNGNQDQMVARKSLNRLLADLVLELVFELNPAAVLEVGAHGGEFSIAIRRKLPEAEIRAVEANPIVFSKYEEELARHRIDYKNLIVSDKEGERTLHVPKGSDGKIKTTMGSILLDKQSQDFDEHRVQSVRLDSLVEGEGENAMWVDVEGACLEVLAGGSKALSQCILFYAELEEKERWEGQATLATVGRRLREFGLIPILTDVQRKGWQSNVLFVRNTLLNDERVKATVERYFREGLALLGSPEEPEANRPAARKSKDKDGARTQVPATTPEPAVAG